MKKLEDVMSIAQRYSRSCT